MPFGEEDATDENMPPDDPSSRGFAAAREVGGAPGLNGDRNASNPAVLFS